jgi:hypothetical protein
LEITVKDLETANAELADFERAKKSTIVSRKFLQSCDNDRNFEARQRVILDDWKSVPGKCKSCSNSGTKKTAGKPAIFCFYNGRGDMI